MAINQEIISTSWEGQQKSYIEAGMKTLLQRMLEVLESPLAANSVGSNQLTQELRDVINSIGSKVPNNRTVNRQPLNADVTIGPGDIMVGNQTLADKLDDMDEAIGQGGDTSGLATRIAALESSLNTLTGANDSTQIIDTFNEVIDFLNNVYNDETLLGKLQQLQTQINSKANDNAVVKGIKANGASTTLPVDQNGVVELPPAGSTISPATAAPSMDGTANVGSSAKYAREDHVHPHDTTKANDNAVVKSVTINGQTPQLNNGNVDLGTIHDGVDGENGITPHIGQDGYWYIGTTNTGVKAQGERGNDGVASADEVVVVNNLDGEPADLEEGQVAVLGAGQGKELKMAIDNKGVSFEVKGDTLFIRTASSPMVNVLPMSIQFDDTIFGNTRTATVHVYGRNLTSQVEVQVSGVGFSGSAQLLPNGDGKVDADVTITFAPTANTGTEAEGGRSYEGSVTAVCNGAESVSATLEGFGVLTIMPRITASIDKAALKGVLDTTADGAYTSEPATATLHVQASSINQVLTLAVDNDKFALSESQISVEDAMRGKDITVTYLRQSAVTATDDEGTITITATHDSTSVQSTVAVSGATEAKKTSGTIAKINGVVYYYSSSKVYCREDANNKPSGEVVIDTFYDEFGYQYSPKEIDTQSFDGNPYITSLVIGDTVTAIYSSAFQGCSGMTYLRFGYLSATRSSIFNSCTSLETVDMTGFSFSYSGMFTGCTKLRKVIVRYSSSGTAQLTSDTVFDKAELTINGESKTVYYYEDGNGVKHQKRLYVPTDKVSSYENHTYWGLFEVHSIDELSE